MNFSSALSKTLFELKLSQHDLAQKSGVHQTAISMYVLGKATPSTKTLALILKTLKPKTRWPLIHAFLRDTVQDIGENPEDVAIQIGPGSTKPALSEVLDAELYETVYALATSVSRNPEHRPLLTHLASMIAKPLPPSAPVPFPAVDHKKRAQSSKSAKRRPADRSLAASRAD